MHIETFCIAGLYMGLVKISITGQETRTMILRAKSSKEIINQALEALTA